MMYIYFIQLENQDGLIKIGQSSKPNKRIRGIERNVPYKIRVLLILREFEEEGITEKVIHKRFRKYRNCGEWFNPCTELKEFLDANLVYGKFVDSYVGYVKPERDVENAVQFLERMKNNHLKISMIGVD